MKLLHLLKKILVNAGENCVCDKIRLCVSLSNVSATQSSHPGDHNVIIESPQRIVKDGFPNVQICFFSKKINNLNF